MNDQVYEIWCGCRKWSISLDLENAAVVVRVGHHPIYGELKLYDVSEKDLSNLADLFVRAADYFRSLEALNKVRKEEN